MKSLLVANSATSYPLYFNIPLLPSMYVILEGQCQVVVNNESVATLNDGEIFGEMGLMFQQPRSADVLSLQNVKVLEIPAEALQESMQRSFQMGLALETLASQRSQQESA